MTAQFFGLLLVFAPYGWAECEKPRASLVFFDVGEGDAILLTSNGESALIDTGNLISGHKVLESLKSRGVSELKQIILTHPHPDHIGGVFQIAQTVPFSSIHDNGEDLETETSDLFRWYHDLVRKDPRYSRIVKGHQLQIGEITAEVLFPTRESMTDDWNTNSLVLRVQSGELVVLLMGDANLATEASLIRSGIDLKANILKVGHHGADDTTAEAFIKKVDPDYSIISVNRDNLRGYPSPSVVKRLKKYSSLLQTHDRGTVTVTLCDDEYEVGSER